MAIKTASPGFIFMHDGTLATGPAAGKVTRRTDVPPLFQKKTLARYRELHAVDELDARHQAMRKWIDADQLGTLDVPETKLDATFLNNVFGDVLGYRNRIVGGERWELEFQDNTAVKGRRAVDGALGRFSADTASNRRIVVIEMKGTDVPLGIGVGGVKSPVEQAWGYANNTGGACRWVIVSNLRETRLYNVNRGDQVWHTFWLKDLADREQFARFCLILELRNLLPDAAGGKSLTERLLDDSAQQQADVTKQLYADYKAIRATLFDHLCKRHSNLPALEVLRCTQMLLDRFLFLAFACKRDLLPPALLDRALSETSHFDPQPLWNNLKVMFRWVDLGKNDKGVPAYNGGLFRTDVGLDDLDIADEDVAQLARLSKYNFRDDVSVEVLGHIFEQSISDLEKMRAQATGVAATEAIGKRDLEGVFYTPGYVTRFIVLASLGKLLLEKRTALKAELAPAPDAPAELQTDAHWRAFNLAWKQVLLDLRIVDPACGSGAFLVAAYDFMAVQYEKLNLYLARLGEEQVDLTDAILRHNLFGVDLNAESVEITKLALWLKTAVRGRKLTDLDRTIRQGNSVVSDPEAHPLAFDWSAGDLVDPAARDPRLAAATPEDEVVQARWADGFDAVIGNPPYVRQEWLDDASKAHWKSNYQCYSGAADLYVYFFERGLKLCKPGGMLGFITNNKWLRAGYGEPLRRWLASEVTVEQLVDFGHARIFEGTDTFPCVLVARWQAPTPENDRQVKVCVLPREVMNPERLDELIAERSFEVDRARFRPEGWTLEPPAVDALMARIRERGAALSEFVGAEPFYGVKTGRNEAFLISEQKRDELVALDPGSADIIKPYLRGEDVGRWVARWDRQFMIFARRGIDIEAYPSVLAHLAAHRLSLEPKPKGWNDATGEWAGRKPGTYKWYEIQDAVDQWPLFEQPKIIYQEIQFHPHYAFDDSGLFGNNTTFSLPSADLYLLGVLNSPLMWWFNWRHLVHAKDEALRPFGFKMTSVPIAQPSAELRAAVETRVGQLIASKRADHEASHVLLDWLRGEHGIDKPGNALQDFGVLTYEQFETEVKKRRAKAKGALKPVHIQGLREAWQTYGKPTAARRVQGARLEAEVARLVEQAYGLTAEEVRLLWETAPPRMPGGGPAG